MMKRTTKTTSSATSKTASASTSMKATESSLVLAGGEATAGAGSISAVNRDAFAASLRESSGVAVGAQKEMSVIEHHRKQSLQRAQQQEQRASTAYSISSHREDHSGGAIGAHTGRTSAYGGRDYEYSANLATTSSRRQSSVQQSSSSSYSQQQQQSGQQSWQQASGGFNARQVAGYSASRQTGAALIQQSSLSSNAASNLYQSTSAGSYKVHQLEATSRDVRGSSTGRRKTWAESSLQHGAAAGIGQSLYAQDFQQHSCPASKVYTDTSPFKYERQSSSGHKLFRQQERGANGSR